MSNGIPLQEFGKMLHEAQGAFEASDLSTALNINDRFGECGYALVVDGGRLRLENMTTPKAMVGVSDLTVNMTRGDYIRR